MVAKANKSSNSRASLAPRTEERRVQLDLVNISNQKLLV